MYISLDLDFLVLPASGCNRNFIFTKRVVEEPSTIPLKSKFTVSPSATIRFLGPLFKNSPETWSDAFNDGGVYDCPPELTTKALSNSGLSLSSTLILFNVEEPLDLHENVVIRSYEYLS